MEIFAETNRLILREILPSDAEGLFEMDSDPLVHTYLGNKPVTHMQQVMDVIDFIRKQYKENGIGRWAMIEKSTNHFVGWAGLKFVQEETNHKSNYYDLGYRLLRKHWGKGFATEAAIASLNYGFQQLGLQEIFAAAHLENKASDRILRKVGFEPDGVFEYDTEIHTWYRVDRVHVLEQPKFL